MRVVVRSADLNSMSASERDRQTADLVASTRRLPNGELTHLDNSIRAYEHKYHLSSEEMRRELSEGKRAETDEICAWLMALRLRERLVKLTARSR